MTVRNKKKNVQFIYGDDSADSVKVEAQTCPLPEMSLEDIYQYFFHMIKQLIIFMKKKH